MRVTPLSANSRSHLREGPLRDVPVGVVDQQAAEYKGMVLRVVPAGVAAFIDVEEVHASLEACRSAAATTRH